MAITRRTFMKGSLATGAAGAFLLGPTHRALGANNDLRIGVIGTGGQGTGHVKRACGHPGVRVVAVSDPDKKRMGSAAKYAEDKQKIKVKQYQDLRKLMDDKEVDAIITAPPNHWHTLVGIWACQAGKDIYIEKPISHNIYEGRQMMKAAEKYKRIVQHGTQTRSDAYLPRLLEFIATGKIGKVVCVRGLCYKPRGSIGLTGKPVQVGPEVDLNLWLGPAPAEPPVRRNLHYDWHWFWATGNGDMGNQGIHEMDQARWALGDPPPASRVISVGGRLGYKDDAETPNTLITFFDYQPAPLIFETRGLRADRPNLRGSQIGIVVECEGGYFAGKHGGKVFDNKGKEVAKISGGGAGDHPANFYKAVRSRKESDIPSGTKKAHESCSLVHMGNVSYRLGQTCSQEDIRAQVKSNKFATETFERMATHLEKNKVDITKEKLTLGPWLEFDAKTDKFIGNDAANKLATRVYRKPFVVPEEV